MIWNKQQLIKFLSTQDENLIFKLDEFKPTRTKQERV